MSQGMIRTVSGDSFWPFAETNLGKVDIGDIAWSLAHQCRYNGHVDRFYSVANHCLVMSRYFMQKKEYKKALEALLHDASEAYMGDIVHPIKQLLPNVVALENRIQAYVLSELGLDEFVEERNGTAHYIMSREVHKLDRDMIPHETSILRDSIKNGSYNDKIGSLYDAPPDMLAGMYEVQFEQLMDMREEGWPV